MRDKDYVKMSAENRVKLVHAVHLHLTENKHTNKTRTCKATVDRVDWNEIKLEGYTSQELSQCYEEIRNNTRGYRTYNEMFDDIITQAKRGDLVKRPPNPFSLWYQHNFKLYTEKYPGVPTAQKMKHAANDYAELGVHEKAKWEEEYRESLDQYRIAMGSQPERSIGHSALPKPPKTPTVLFAEDTGRQDYSELSIKKKKKYILASMELLKEYRARVKVLQQKHDDLVDPVKPKSKRYNLSHIEFTYWKSQILGMPQEPGRSIRDHYATTNNLNPTDAKDCWNDMSNSEKQAVTKQWKKAVASFEDNFKAWYKSQERWIQEEVLFSKDVPKNLILVLESDQVDKSKAEKTKKPQRSSSEDEVMAAPPPKKKKKKNKKPPTPVVSASESEEEEQDAKMESESDEKEPTPPPSPKKKSKKKKKPVESSSDSE